jgi:hypothetical protein
MSSDGVESLHIVASGRRRDSLSHMTPQSVGLSDVYERGKGRKEKGEG